MEKTARFKLFAFVLLMLSVLLWTACNNDTTQSNNQNGDASSNESSSNDTTQSNNQNEDASSNESSDEVQHISIATGNDGGVFYRIGAGLADIINRNSDTIQATAEASGGSNENVRLVGTETVEFALAGPSTDVPGYEGEDPYDEAYTDLRGVIGGYLQPGVFVVREDSDIEDFSDMEGKTIALAVGPIGTFVAQDVLEEYGLTANEDYDVAQLGYSDQIDALRDGQIDVGVFTTASPNPSVMQMAEEYPIRIISGDEEILDTAVEKRYAYVTTVPADTYEGVDYDVTTYAIGATFISHANVPDDVVYEFLDVMHNNFDDFKEVHPQAEEFAEHNIEQAQTIPLHPGAEKWLEEHGWIE